MSDLPCSAADAVPPDNTSQWLRNLDFVFNSSNKGPTTPSSIRTEEDSTPALPQGIEDSEGTATPQGFWPEDENGARTISTNTYNKISEFTVLFFHHASFRGSRRRAHPRTQDSLLILF